MKKILIFLLLTISFLGHTQNPGNLKNGVIIGGDTTGTSADPIGYKEGQIYWNETLGKFRKYNGTVWSDLVATGGGSGAFEVLDEGGGNGIVITGRTAENYGNVGNGAIDMSYGGFVNSIVGARGQYSFAVGWNSIAEGNYSTSLGQSNNSSGFGSSAFGISNISSGDWSFSAGTLNTATGNEAIAIGYQNNAGAPGAVSLGRDNNSGSQYSVSLGYGNNSVGGSSFTIGNLNTAYGTGSGALGYNAIARSFSEISIGTYGTDYIANSTTALNAADRIFNVGNGIFQGNSDAFTILKNGQIGINIDNFEANTTGETLQVNGTVKANAFVGDGSGLTGVGGGSTTIINDLVTGGTTDALSAQQGVVLKGLIDGVTTNLAPLETTATIIDLSSTIGNYDYAVTPTTSDTFTLTGVVTGGKADVLIDTTGDIDFPTVTGSERINSSLFEAGVIYDMYVENNGAGTYHSFVKRDISLGESKVISMSLSDPDSDLTTGDKDSFHVPYDCTITNYWIGVNEAPTGSAIIVDVKKNGVSITSSGAEISATEDTSETGTGVSPTITTTSFSKYDKITPNVVQVGSTITGAGLKLYLEVIKL